MSVRIFPCASARRTESPFSPKATKRPSGDTRGSPIPVRFVEELSDGILEALGFPYDGKLSAIGRPIGTGDAFENVARRAASHRHPGEGAAPDVDRHLP